MLTIEQIRDAVTGVEHRPVTFTPEPRHAAVAMILADGEHELEACFIRRAERAGDPWSGQVAFPGGRASAGDASAAAAAERETLEEVGLIIGAQHMLGPLPTHSISRGGSNMTLSPFVYYLPGQPGERPPQAVASPREPAEVASVFWVPLEHLFDEATSTTLDYPSGGVLTSFPGIGFEDHVIWGLTLRVLGTFASLMRRELPALT